MDSEIRTGPTGQVYYTYELCFKSPPAVHRLFCLSVADGELIVLTLICKYPKLSPSTLTTTDLREYLLLSEWPYSNIHLFEQLSYNIHPQGFCFKKQFSVHVIQVLNH